jgi:hypothetical protein
MLFKATLGCLDFNKTWCELLEHLKKPAWSEKSCKN